VTATITRFEATIAPCGKPHDGEQVVNEDQEGLVTEEITFTCGCKSTHEEFHDGSFHRMTVDHHGKVLLDEELRGE
jgi:hypothetical protein